ncbi:MAG: hypothetical protein OQK73_01915 [Gammaproteobacteria bacterium]|nr:hypothetical protein [Gammaproteobacteria bacterium]
MKPSIFSSSSDYIDAFNAGLVELLKYDNLGTLILGCANASFDPLIFDATHEALLHQFERLQYRYVDDFKQGHQVNESDEDLLVFLKMISVGFDNLSATEFCREGVWEMQFNHIRAFRPKRMSGQMVNTILRPFSDNRFHFNKSFIQKERFWEGDLEGRQVSLFYNKYPFMDYHTLLLPDREKALPQYLEQEYHEYVWSLCEELGQNLEGLGVGYNAHGAHASVNHLHFQLYLRPTGLPVMAGNWRHNGGQDEYPAQCEVFKDCEQAWLYIEELHAAQTPYNLIYQPGRIFIFPRQFQGNYSQAEWSGGFSWYEMGGGTITFNRQAYNELVEDDILEEFKKLRLDNQEQSAQSASMPLEV